MLSIGKLAAGPTAGRYYVEQVARGREDYYIGAGEAQGRWVGSGLASLGPLGEVSGEAVARLLRAEHPATGQQLRTPVAEGAVAGFDLTFRAPKSVSLLFGIGDRRTAELVADAHEFAVEQALRYLEREACQVRRGRGGTIRLQGDGFVAAAFPHRSSRAGDPLLHTHVVVANEAFGPDGRWTALFGQPIYQHAKTAGYVYQAILRDQLTCGLGVQWQQVVNGMADIDGVSRGVIEHFSRRRQEIMQTMRDRGEHTARAAQIATLDTRRVKQHEVAVEDLRGDWRARAAEHGLDPEDLQALMHRAQRPPLERRDRVEFRRRLLGPDGLTRQASTFLPRDVLRVCAAHARAGATLAELDAQVKAVLADDQVVRVGEDRYSTRELIQTERELLSSAQRRRDEPGPPLALTHIDDALDARPTLSDEQRRLVDQIVAGPGGVQVVRAPAGSGKTFALDTAREAWQRADIPVLGCALSARAAAELRDQAAIETTTVRRLRHGLEHGAQFAQGSVLIVDEAGMVGTRDLAALADAAERSGARLVLVGDDRQLPEIDAGGAFGELARGPRVTELHEVRRQQQEWDRDALAQLRDGDVEQFSRRYREHGRLIGARTAEHARRALVDDWWASTRDGQLETLMIAHRRSDVRDLNQRARTLIRKDGRLGPDELHVKEKAFAVGDQVIATRNDHRHNIHNGLTGTLTNIDQTTLTVLDKRDREHQISRSYAEHGHLDHGYALTAHRAQGATVDRSFVLGSDELCREWGYTAMSRHRDQATFYVSATPTYLNQPAPPLEHDDDTQRAVTRSLQRSRRQELADRQPPHDPRTDALHRAESELKAAEASIEQSSRKRRRTSLFDRSERARLAWTIDSSERAIERCTSRIADLRDDLEHDPAEPAPALARPVSPLDHLEIDPGPGRDLLPEVDLDHDPDIGPAPPSSPPPPRELPDLGPDLGIDI